MLEKVWNNSTPTAPRPLLHCLLCTEDFKPYLDCVSRQPAWYEHVRINVLKSWFLCTCCTWAGVEPWSSFGYNWGHTKKLSLHRFWLSIFISKYGSANRLRTYKAKCILALQVRLGLGADDDDEEEEEEDDDYYWNCGWLFQTACCWD